MPAAFADIRFRTPVGSINVPPASLRCLATGKAEPLFLSDLLLNIAIMSEKENNVPVADTTSSQQAVTQIQNEEVRILNDEYFKEQSERIQEEFNKKNVEDHRQYLLNQSKCMKTLLTKLELPWDRYIPILHYGFVLYLQRVESSDSRTKAAKLTTDLMSCVAFLSQSGRLINNMAGFYNQQIIDLEKLMEEAKANEVVTEPTENDSQPL